MKQFGGDLEQKRLDSTWSAPFDFTAATPRASQASVELPVLLTTRAAAFSKRCNLSVMVLDDPANTVLQPSIRDVGMQACTVAHK